MSLVGHWRLDGNTKDSIRNNDGSGSPTYVDGKLGQGIDGDGTNISVSGSEISTALSGNQMSLSLWWKQNNTNNYSDIISSGGFRLERGSDSYPSQSDYWCNWGAGSSDFRNEGVNITNGDIGISQGQWFHIVVRRKGSDLEVWINGELDRSTSTNLSMNYGESFTINPENSNSYIDDIRLYNHAISEKRITQLSRAKALHYKFNQGTEWTRFGESYGTINQSGGEVTISQTAGGGSNSNIIGMYSAQTVGVGESVTYRVKNTEGRHAAIAGLSDGEAQAFPHDSGGGAAVSLYSRADDVSSNTSFQDEDGNTSSSTPSIQDYRSYRTIRIDRPDNSTVKIYVDGGLETTFNGTFKNPKNVYFAADGNDTPNTIKVDRVSINGEPNSINTEVSDASGQGNDGELNGPTFSDSSNIGSGAYDFSGNEEYIETTDPVPGGDPEVTLSAWAKADTTNQNRWTGIIALGTNQDTNTSFMVTTGGNGDEIEAHTWSYSTSGVAIDTNWHHFAAVNTGNGEQRFYVDGEFIDSMSNTLSIPSETGVVGTRRYTIENNNTTRFWDGKITDARIYASAFSDSEIKSLYEQRASIDSGGVTHSHELSEEVSNGLTLKAFSRGNDS